MLKLTDDATAAAMGENAHRLYWADPPTTQAHTEKLLGIYRKVLGEHRARGALAQAARA
jgi:hypothetical protein